jgi:putative membrane-bound dehydrogenase-like protein
MKVLRALLVALVLLQLGPRVVLGQGYSPREAAARMTVPDGLAIAPFASEPLVRQPVAIEFDDRGRLWVIQYLQYPNPAGLARVKVDRYSRTVYDRIPEPPPRGPKGADRITILEDTDRDGAVDRAKDFIAGLNLASGLAFGHGGVFVLQTPYLLFYPDRNRDDVPDGDPQVLLTGFGMEDAHSVANSLTWGPDGWLYGNQGSTVTARINGVEFQQGIWRYHPLTKKFELFCEGGGNMWGLDFNRRGDLFASTNVGGFVMLHAMQGGYYWKSFGKHGPLHNPYTFGYFDHVTHENLHGGHVAVGGLFYEADALPPSFRGKYFSGDLLDHSAHWHAVTRRGSTFQAKLEGDLLKANDTWFAPSDMTLGPDGSIYLTDWHDQRTAHPDPDADWDRSNGRIYRLSARGVRPVGIFDLHAKSSSELVALLSNANTWYVRRARSILSERRDASVTPGLRKTALDGPSIAALEALWCLYGCGAFDARLAEELLRSADPDMRVATIRLLANAPELSLDPTLTRRLQTVAESDPDVRVRAQLASYAQRDPVLGMSLVAALLRHAGDINDPHIPLLLWWAVERVCKSGNPELERLWKADWDSDLMRVTMERLMRRYAADDTDRCAAMLAARDRSNDRRLLLQALDDALAGRRAEAISPALVKQIARLAAGEPGDTTLLRLSARVGDPAARTTIFRRACDPNEAESVRVSFVELIADLETHDSMGTLLPLALSDKSARVQDAALRALAKSDDTAIPKALLAAYGAKNASWRQRTRDLLLSRKTWARRLLAEVDRGRIGANDIPLDQVGRVALLGDAELDSTVRKLWGKISSGTPEEKLAEVRRLNNDLRAAAGDIKRGQELFRKQCASCHKLFGEGASIGPELTHANRRDRDFLLVSLVDPSAVVRKEYQASLIQMRDGRVISGLIAESKPSHVTVVVSATERVTAPRADIEEMTDSPASLMPESLYREFSPGQLRDLFAYLEAEEPSK